jgi:hypothetical protein
MSVNHTYFVLFFAVLPHCALKKQLLSPISDARERNAEKQTEENYLQDFE